MLACVMLRVPNRLRCGFGAGADAGKPSAPALRAPAAPGEGGGACTGPLCESEGDPCDLNPCQNGGACAVDAEGKTQCTCLDGFKGDLCETAAEPCAPNPCLNGGGCATDDLGHPVCTCPDGFSGDLCEIPPNPCDPNPCLNGGQCVTWDDDTIGCACPEGYTGKLCANVVDPCVPNPCLNDGECLAVGAEATVCACPEGYTGNLCEQEPSPCDIYLCINGGDCDVTPEGLPFCACPEGYSGENCEISPPKVLFTESFDSDEKEFAPFLEEATWTSYYDEDPWRTDLNGGVIAVTDDGCPCPMPPWNPCGFAVYEGNSGQAISDPYDNHIAHKPKVPWTDVSISLRFQNADDDTVGVLFRYVNSGNFYALLMTQDAYPADGCDVYGVGPLTQIIRVTQGQVMLLASVDESYAKKVPHDLEIVAIGNVFTVYLDDAVLISATDELVEPHLAGGMGLLAVQNGADDPECLNGDCWFDDIVVKSQ